MRNLISEGRTSEVFKEGKKAYKIYSSSSSTQTQMEKVFEILDLLPFEPTLAHRDFHPHNLICYQGHYWILDWINGIRKSTIILYVAVRNICHSFQKG